MKRSEFREPPQKKCGRMGLISHYRSDLLNVPYPRTIRISATLHRLPRVEIAPIGQRPIAVDGLVAAPLQFVADRRFTGAGYTLD